MIRNSCNRKGTISHHENFWIRTELKMKMIIIINLFFKYIEFFTQVNIILMEVLVVLIFFINVRNVAITYYFLRVVSGLCRFGPNAVVVIRTFRIFDKILLVASLSGFEFSLEHVLCCVNIWSILYAIYIVTM